jgi:hypothetical protein
MGALMVSSLASLSLGGWLMLLILAAVVPLAICVALLLLAFLPSGAGAAGWRDEEVLPRRAGTAKWRELHPRWPVPSSTVAPRLVGLPAVGSGDPATVRGGRDTRRHIGTRFLEAVRAPGLLSAASKRPDEPGGAAGIPERPPSVRWPTSGVGAPRDAVGG